MQEEFKASLGYEVTFRCSWRKMEMKTHVFCKQSHSGVGVTSVKYWRKFALAWPVSKNEVDRAAADCLFLVN